MVTFGCRDGGEISWTPKEAQTVGEVLGMSGYIRFMIFGRRLSDEVMGREERGVSGGRKW